MFLHLGHIPFHIFQGLPVVHNLLGFGFIYNFVFMQQIFMNRIKYLVLASMLVLSLSVSAQHASKDSKAAKHTVSGKIVDAENGSATKTKQRDLLQDI